MRRTLDLAIAFQAAGWEVEDVTSHLIRLKRGDVAVTVDAFLATDEREVYAFNCDFKRDGTPSVAFLESLHAALTHLSAGRA
jgi:hypothetical protein